ncbi:MAG: CHAT domain-containing protein, partial [Prochloraceae cyanobacterium]
AEEKPQIVHFCGHGLEDGSLLLEDEGGHNKSVSPDGLASLFQLHANYVNCVLLNACHSAQTAEAISKYINYVIGMNQPIGDQAAIAFAQGFYDGLGYAIPDNQDVIQRAFEEGKVAIQLEISHSMATRKMTVVSAKDEPVKIPQHLIPVLQLNPKPVSIANNEKEPLIEVKKSPEAREDDEPQVPQLTNSTPATLPSFRQAKVKTLQKSLEVLSAKYEAAYKQLDYTLSEVDRISLRGQIESLEREIVQVESELSKLID